MRLLLSRHACDAEALDKYGKSLALSYVEDNARVNFCPSVPWCGHAVQVGKREDRGQGAEGGGKGRGPGLERMLGARGGPGAGGPGPGGGG